MPLKRSDNVSDQVLLLQLKQGNRLAFNEIYLRFWESLYRFGFSILHDEDQTKDILQDIFFSIWKNREHLNIQNLSAYLHQSVKFEVIRALKNSRLRESHAEHLAALPSLNTTEEALRLLELEGQVKDTLDRLPEKCRKVFYLSRFNNLSNKEIAEELNLSQRTVEWHISNALQHLRLSITEAAGILAVLLAAG